MGVSREILHGVLELNVGSGLSRGEEVLALEVRFATILTAITEQEV